MTSDDVEAMLNVAAEIKRICKSNNECDGCPFCQNFLSGNKIHTLSCCRFTDSFGEGCYPHEWILDWESDSNE